MGKSDINVAGQTLQYGGEVDFKRFKPPSMADEAQVSGDFYGKRKGFDMGDIAGERSVFAAGKEKLSSIFSPKENLPDYLKRPKEDFKEPQKDLKEPPNLVEELEVSGGTVNWGDDQYKDDEENIALKTLGIL